MNVGEPHRKLHAITLGKSGIAYDSNSYNTMYYLRSRIRTDTSLSSNDVEAVTMYIMDMDVDIPRLEARTFVRDTATNQYRRVTELDCEVDGWTISCNEQISRSLLPLYGLTASQLVFVYNNRMCDKALLINDRIAKAFGSAQSLEFSKRIEECVQNMRRQ